MTSRPYTPAPATLHRAKAKRDRARAAAAKRAQWRAINGELERQADAIRARLEVASRPPLLRAVVQEPESPPIPESDWPPSWPVLAMAGLGLVGTAAIIAALI